MLVSFKIVRMVIISMCFFMCGVFNLQAEEAQTQNSYAGMSDAMQKSMDPQVWTNMMAMMMNPEKMMSMESCAQCHDGEDVARYAKDYGPMMEAMKPMAEMMSPHMMAQMMNPNTYMSMMYPMMNPAMYMNMMAPMMGMMGPMSMGMMNPAMYMNMMYPMMGMLGPMTGMGMSGMGMPGMGMPGMGMHGNPMAQMPGGQMMDPKTYEEWFKQWNEMMKNFTPQAQSNQ